MVEYTSKTYPLEMTQGDDEEFTFIYSDDTGTPIDLTGYDISMIVAWGQGVSPISGNQVGPEGYILREIGSGITIADPTTGEFVVTFSNDETATIPVSGYVDAVRAVYYQLRIDGPPATTLLAGPIRMYPDRFTV